MQLVIASAIVGGVILFVGMALLKFIKLDIRNKMANNALRSAAMELMESDDKPTKIERATAEAKAKAKLKLALNQYNARINELFEMDAKG